MFFIKLISLLIWSIVCVVVFIYLTLYILKPPEHYLPPPPPPLLLLFTLFKTLQDFFFPPERIRLWRAQPHWSGSHVVLDWREILARFTTQRRADSRLLHPALYTMGDADLKSWRGISHCGLFARHGFRFNLLISVMVSMATLLCMFSALLRTTAGDCMVDARLRNSTYVQLFVVLCREDVISPVCVFLCVLKL